MAKSRCLQSGALRVGVPPFRSQKDISLPEDILEEVLRIYGFDNVQPVMPAVPIMPLHVEKPLKMEHKIRRVLTTAHQFLEVHNYVWYNDNWLKTLDYEPGKTLVLKNPTSPETSRLRTHLIPNLLALVPKNRPFRESFRLFEIGRTFFQGRQDGECTERHHLGGVAYQRAGGWEEFYLSIKSAAEDVLTACGIQNVNIREPVGTLQALWQSPGNYVSVCSGNKSLGTLGILDKELTAKICREGGQIVWFELELDKITDGDIVSTLYPAPSFEEPPRYPLSWQDFSLLWKVEDGFGQLESILDRFSDPLVIRREFLVSYRGKGLEKGTACYSFRFWIGSPEHTLSGEDIESFHQQFLAFIKKNDVALRT